MRILLKLSAFLMLVLMYQMVSAADVQQKPLNKKNWKMQCVGTEPFWSFSLGKRFFIYETPDTEKMSFKILQIQHGQAIPQKMLSVYSTKACHGKKTATLIVKKNEHTCSDGMSDTKYPYDAILIFSDKVLSGCCKK